MRNLFVCLLLGLPASLWAQANLGPITTPQINTTYYAGSIIYPTIQSAVTAACASSAGGVVSKGYGVTTTDTPTAITGGCTKVEIVDQSAVFTSYYNWSGSAYVAGPQTVNGGLTVTGVLNGGTVNSTGGALNAASIGATTPGSGFFNRIVNIGANNTGPTGGPAQQGYSLNYATSNAWYKLGTVVFGTANGSSGDDSTLDIQINWGTNTAIASSQAITHILARPGANNAAPNLSGVSAFTLGNPGALLGVAFVATGASTSVTNESWDVYIQQAAYGGGYYTVTALSGDTWTNIDASASAPGAASSTVMVGSLYMLMDNAGNGTFTGLTTTGSATLAGANISGVAPITPGTIRMSYNTASGITYIDSLSMTTSAVGTMVLRVANSTGTTTYMPLTLNNDGSATTGPGTWNLQTEALGHLANATGLQFFSAGGCSFTAGAIGNTCTTTITLPVTANNATGTPVCSIAGPTGATILGNTTMASASSVTVASYALSTTATGAGTIHCIVAD